jgi:hypothetical protein
MEEADPDLVVKNLERVLALPNSCSLLRYVPAERLRPSRARYFAGTLLSAVDSVPQSSVVVAALRSVSMALITTSGCSIWMP